MRTKQRYNLIRKFHAAQYSIVLLNWYRLVVVPSSHQNCAAMHDGGGFGLLLEQQTPLFPPQASSNCACMVMNWYWVVLTLSHSWSKYSKKIYKMNGILGFQVG